MTLQIVDASGHLLVLDHHKTAQAALADIDHAKAKIVFDMERSGAGLAWDYFYPLATGSARPPLIDMVEDRDLWRFQHEGSKRLHYALTCLDPTPDAQFISICRWLQLIHKNWLAPLENAVFSTPWA